MTALQRLDPARILAGSYLADFEQHDVLNSTQDRAHELASSATTRLPLLVVANEQRSGRGRGGNVWFTGRGSLAMSLVYDPAEWGLCGGFDPRRSLAAALAVIDAIAPWTTGLDVGLHWPNDVFCAERKIAGILIDALPNGRHVLGIGINTNNAFDDADEEVRARAVSLMAATGAWVDHERLLLRFLDRLQEITQLLAADPAAFWRRCQELCRQVGRELTLRSGSETITGYCTGVALDGGICLDTMTGSRKFYSGVLVHELRGGS